MVLYTPLALEDIFPQDLNNPGALVEMTVNGRLCLVRRDADGIPRLERLLSTDPNDYLIPDLAPGTALQF